MPTFTDRSWSADALDAYLQIVWHACREAPEHPELERLLRSLRHGPYRVDVRIFDSTGQLDEVAVQVDRGGFRVSDEADDGPRSEYRWVVSRRYLQDVLARPTLYAQDPSRLDLGWLWP